VEDEVIGGLSRTRSALIRSVLRGDSEALEHLGGGVLESRFVAFGENPRFRTGNAGVGSDGEEIVVFRDYADASIGFLANDVRRRHSVFCRKILLGSGDFFRT